MTSNVVVVGSGATGVHFAQTALEKGVHVTMIDAGARSTPPALPDASITALRAKVDDPAEFFLGRAFEAVITRDATAEYYGFSPQQDYAVQRGGEHDGMEVLHSFAGGGLAQVWTAGAYPFNDLDLEDFPFGYDGLKSSYDEVARRIGVSGDADDLTQFFPMHKHLQPPLRLDAASQSLLAAYVAKRNRVNAQGVFVGRSRVATLSQPIGERGACEYLGRCKWGCPRSALYTPSTTLATLQRHPSFRYLSGRIVRHLLLRENGTASSLVCRRAEDGGEETVAFERVVLAAGTLGSAEIMLRTFREAGSPVRLHGLMDNRQVLVPFAQLRRLGRLREETEYLYHLLAMTVVGEQPSDFVHCQVTTLTAGLLHPVLQRLPCDLRTSILIGRLATAAFGVVNLNFPDTRRRDCEAWLDDDQLRLRYVPPADESPRLARAVTRVRRALRTLGCFAPHRMQHVRPMGASAHYAGLFPMSAVRQPLTTAPDCRSWDIPNVYFADGSTFPALPAKNLTFTLMANATRVATEAF